ncbi:hypothetical protein JTB14_024689 [Gonioctena quinquepunctata]|nr:hypothetical protein JTB14_024689 [Gonioctena quinquepunctata]
MKGNLYGYFPVRKGHHTRRQLPSLARRRARKRPCGLSRGRKASRADSSSGLCVDLFGFARNATIIFSKSQHVDGGVGEIVGGGSGTGDGGHGISVRVGGKSGRESVLRAVALGDGIAGMVGGGGGGGSSAFDASATSVWGKNVFRGGVEGCGMLVPSMFDLAGRLAIRGRTETGGRKGGGGDNGFSGPCGSVMSRMSKGGNGGRVEMSEMVGGVCRPTGVGRVGALAGGPADSVICGLRFANPFARQARHGPHTQPLFGLSLYPFLFGCVQGSRDPGATWRLPGTSI